MGFNIKQYLTADAAALKVKATTDGSNGEVTHHHVDSSALPAGAATAAKQDAALAELQSIDDRLAAGINVGVQFPATQPVSGPLTNAELRASAVPVTGGLTDAQLRAAAVPVSVSGVATAAKQDTLAALVGEVQANPTANTVLDRLKTIASALAGLLGVTPQMASGGNISAQTANPGTTYTAFGSQACKQLTIVNDTGTTILVQQGAAGVGVPIFDQSAFTFFGLTNANALGVKRKDDGNTQVTVAARWEA